MYLYYYQLLRGGIGQVTDLWQLNGSKNVLLQFPRLDSTQFYPGSWGKTTDFVFDFPTECIFPGVDDKGVGTLGGNFRSQVHRLYKRFETDLDLDTAIARCK